MKDQIENPKGLHARYNISKIKFIPNPKYGSPIDNYGNATGNDWQEYIETEVNVDPKAEYFVLRLDTGGSDIEHVKAGRIGIHAYAEAIKQHLPQLSADLIERYPLL